MTTHAPDISLLCPTKYELDEPNEQSLCRQFVNSSFRRFVVTHFEVSHFVVSSLRHTSGHRFMTYLELAQRARADLARDPACAQGTTIAADPSGSQGTTIAADPPDGRAANLASQQESHSVIHPASPVSLPTDPARLFTHLSALLLIIQCGCRNGHHHNLPVASPAIIDALEAAIHPAADDAEIPRLLDQLRPDGPGPTLAAVIAMYRRRLTLLTSLGEDTFFAEAELTLSLHYQPRKDNL